MALHPIYFSMGNICKDLGSGPKKTPFSSNISFISESFLFFNTKTRQRIFVT